MLEVSPGSLDYSLGLDLLDAEMASLRASSVLQVPMPMRGSAWIEEHGRISAETSAEPGKILLWGYQREPADVMCGNDHDQVTVLKGTRAGYSNLLKQSTAYYLVHEATSVFIALPTNKEAEDFWRQELAPLFRDVKELADLRRRATRGQPSDTITDVMLANHAMLYLRGAENDNNFRGKAARRRIADEFDATGWMPKKGSQGSKLDLMRSRGEGFFDGSDIVGSTPLDQSTSNIWKEWLRSDQRHYHVTCPHCSTFQKLVFGGRKEGRGIWYDLAPGTQRVDRAYYKCEGVAGCEIDETHKFKMIDEGVWVAERPEVQRHAGFHMWQGMSLHPKAAWKRIAQRWVDAQGDASLLKPFFNNVLGLPWTPLEGKTVSASALVERCVPYPAECPDDVVLLTAGVDTQKGSDDQTAPNASRPRVEISIWGWGRGKEAWLIGHWTLDRHDPWSDEMAAELDELLLRPFRKQDGTEMFVHAAGLDIGAYGDAVKAFCGMRPRRNLWPVKGDAITKGKRRGFIWPRRASRSTKVAGTQWFMLDTQKAKDDLEIYLKRGGRGPGTVHFPAWCATTDYFEGLTAEKKFFIKANGGWHWDAKNKKKNSGEEWDAWVYAFSALEGVIVSDRRYRDLNLAAARLGIPAYVPPHDPETGELLDEDPAMAVYDVGPDRSAQAEQSAPEAAPPPTEPTRASRSKAPASKVVVGGVDIDLRTGAVEAPVPQVKRVQKVRRVGRTRW